MKKIKIILSVIAGVFAMSSIANAKEGVYIGADVSSYVLETSGANEESEFTKINFNAGYKINDFVAVEAGLFVTGDYNQDGGGTSSMNGFTLDVLGSYEVANSVNLIGLIGFNSLNYESELEGGSTTETNELDGTGMRYGFGVGYDVSDNLSTRLMYVLSNNDLGVDDVDGFSDIKLGVTYSF